MSSDEAVAQAILAGDGVSILSRYALGADAGQAQLACLDVEGFPLERHLYFVYPIGKQLSAAATAFMDLVRSKTRQLTVKHGAQSLSVASRDGKRTPAFAN